VNRELHFLNVGLLARLQISEREIGDLQNSGPIPRGSFKFGLRRVLRLRLAGVELRRKEELPVLVGRVHVPCVRPGISFISEMPALDIDRIGSRRGPGEIARVMMLALSSVDRPAVLHRLRVEDKTTERLRKPLAPFLATLLNVQVPALQLGVGVAREDACAG